MGAIKPSFFCHPTECDRTTLSTPFQTIGLFTRIDDFFPVSVSSDH